MCPALRTPRRVVTPATTTRPPPHPAPSTDDVSIPPARMDPRRQERPGMVPVFTANRSISLAPSFAPAASPRLRRRPSPWPPHRHAKPASESTTQTDGRALHPGPYPPDLSRCHAYGASLPLVPLVYRLISLAGPDPSGSTRPSRLCQRCFPPFPASPGSDCAQLLPGCCDNPARRTRTSFGFQRLTAHQRLMAHSTAREF